MAERGGIDTYQAEWRPGAIYRLGKHREQLPRPKLDIQQAFPDADAVGLELDLGDRFGNHRRGRNRCAGGSQSTFNLPGLIDQPPRIAHPPIHRPFDGCRRCQPHIWNHHQEAIVVSLHHRKIDSGLLHMVV